ncbi:Integrase, catalytic region (fragment) [metagenome]|uniref:Integrase, catalytic region n=1 Tax=metagenome TaxID=256318 RepID=A0A2P2CCC2_9ZZZZ
MTYVGNRSTPYKPTTQGKNERFHPVSLPQQVAAGQQPGRVTHQMAWEATEKAEAPPPRPQRRPMLVPTGATQSHPRPVPTDLPTGTRVRKLTSAGTFMLSRVTYMVDGQHGFQQVLVITDGDTITVADLDGEILIEHTRPAPGVRYVGNGRPRGPRPTTSKTSPRS